MTPDDDPWNPKAQRHSVISESHDYGKFLVKITMSVISWNGPFYHVGKESTFPSYPIGHERMLSHHYWALLWMNEWMNERCPPVIIPGMHHSPSGRFLKFWNNWCGYITTIPKFLGKKKESLRTSVFFYRFFHKTSGSSFERTGTDDSLIMGEKIQKNRNQHWNQPPLAGY